MSVAVENREPQDLTYVNVDEPLELHWWSVRFSATPDEVHAAVKEVGPSAEEVAKKLKKAAKTSFRAGGED